MPTPTVNSPSVFSACPPAQPLEVPPVFIEQNDAGGVFDHLALGDQDSRILGADAAGDFGDGAKAYLAQLKKEKRYVRDVY